MSDFSKLKTMKIDEIVLSTRTVDINNLFSSSGMVCYEKYVY